MILSPVAIERYIWEVARCQWHEEQYNIAILSGLFTQSSNLWQMMKMFDSIIWFLVFISIITITFFLTLNQIHQNKIYSSEQGKRSLNIYTESEIDHTYFL